MLVIVDGLDPSWLKIISRAEKGLFELLSVAMDWAKSQADPEGSLLTLLILSSFRAFMFQHTCDSCKDSNDQN